MYKHTQTGGIMILSALGMCVTAVAGWYLTPRGLLFFPLAAAAAFIYFGFRELTVEVDHEAVRLHFTFGWFKKEFKFLDIESAAAMRNKWWNGWGIKYVWTGWLYNVGGLDAVELRLKSGRVARIGTDEPAALEAAILARLARKP